MPDGDTRSQVLAGKFRSSRGARIPYPGRLRVRGVETGALKNNRQSLS